LVSDAAQCRSFQKRLHGTFDLSGNQNLTISFGISTRAEWRKDMTDVPQQARASLTPEQRSALHERTNGYQAGYDAGYHRGKAWGRIQGLGLGVGIALAAATAWYGFIKP
jgi:hypothetical protein